MPRASRSASVLTRCRSDLPNLSIFQTMIASNFRALASASSLLSDGRQSLAPDILSRYSPAISTPRREQQSRNSLS